MAAWVSGLFEPLLDRGPHSSKLFCFSEANSAGRRQTGRRAIGLSRRMIFANFPINPFRVSKLELTGNLPLFVSALTGVRTCQIKLIAKSSLLFAIISIKH